MRDHHPLYGQTLEVFSRTHRQGIFSLTLVLPDGSRSLIPAAWTDLEGNDPLLDDRHSPLLGSLAHLLHARKVIDALLRKVDASEATTIPLQEETRRATATVPLVRSGKEHLGGPRPRDTKKGHRSFVQIDGKSGSFP